MFGPKVKTSFLCAVMMTALVGCGDRSEEAAAPKAADMSRIAQAEAEPGNWLSHGRTYAEQRYSPLDQITAENVGDLGLAWVVDLDTNRGQESTPLVVDGTMYVTTAWSMVKAYDAATGKELWNYDPEVDRSWGVKACCDAVNRGAAYWEGKVYVGTLDGRLIALDAKTGERLWEKLTVDKAFSYTITGAPRVIKGKVIIGNGGAEYGVRGYITAYDADTGDQAWRFYTVPGNPADGFENDAMKMAAETWHGEWWNLGGGGTVWDSMAYDPELDLLYIGVGNGAPWNRAIRSPGGGDNLFLSSIVAIKPETGEYVWHFQTTPGESWDYTATQQITLAELELDGKTRKVLMQAPKNGFFYVIDRETGEFISGGKFVALNWATGLDANGRPIEVPAARYEETGEPWQGFPGPAGAHSWHSMSYNPNTGLVYLPVQEPGFVYAADPNFKAEPLGFNTGTDMTAASVPQIPAVRKMIKDSVVGHLAAWDPVAQKEVWRVELDSGNNGGTLTTVGNLVFQGNSHGNFVAYSADKGTELWSRDLQTGIVAAPVTYEVNGEQYVAVVAGWGGIFALAPGELGTKGGATHNISRVWAFKLGGTAEMPAMPEFPDMVLNPPALTASEGTVEQGRRLYDRFCAACHGDAAYSAGVVPDLRYSTALHDDFWFQIVLEGALADNGMANFSAALTREEAAAIRSYVIMRSNQTKDEMDAEKAGSGN